MIFLDPEQARKVISGLTGTVREHRLWVADDSEKRTERQLSADQARMNKSKMRKKNGRIRST